MSLDNIQLSSLLVEKLYSKNLYNLNPSNEKNEVVQTGLITSLGYNEKNILIVVNEPNALHVQEDDLKLLTGILSACKLSLADVCLVNADKNKAADFKTLNDGFNPSIVLLFGIEPSALDFPLQFPPFQLQQYNGQQYLLSPSLNALALDKSLKKQLWDMLQKIFN